MEVSGQRLYYEWQKWQAFKDRPVGFKAEPSTFLNGSFNLYQWKCLITGPESSPWEGGKYTVIMSFPPEFPKIPPKCRIFPPIFHPNVSDTGDVYIPDLAEDMCWSPDFTIGQILMRIQKILVRENST
ncbi:SUMO-conjugating enzyme UBC9-B-like [Drosophila serrata]|uniref:SUMO-conjugating enzyme UBC9-B-like n=1 Tax=Drosophila serrata TaxID=7274 RepID=UPI000A1CF462|nr:SUMO-conjugating enzyme UBC9-B-like [Drosophila serrata]